MDRLCSVTPAVTEPVAKPATVTKPATPTTKTIAVACAQCQLYEAEIKRPKLALAAAQIKAEPVPAKEACARCASHVAGKAPGVVSP